MRILFLHIFERARSGPSLRRMVWAPCARSRARSPCASDLAQGHVALPLASCGGLILLLHGQEDAAADQTGTDRQCGNCERGTRRAAHAQKGRMSAAMRGGRAVGLLGRHSPTPPMMGPIELESELESPPYLYGAEE